MAGIAGIATTNAVEDVKEMLDRIRYRGRSDIRVSENEGTTFGIVWNDHENGSVSQYSDTGEIGYYNSPGSYVRVIPENGRFKIFRDELGVTPLYYGLDDMDNICFASEIKALLPVANEINELVPGHFLDGGELHPYFNLNTGASSAETPEKIASVLHDLLDEAIAGCIRTEHTGSWLSGGLDSSVICALAAGHMKKLTTFSAGLKGAPDLEFAREVASFIKSDHYELIVNTDELITALPEVIWHLESFDALLVRSTITNYLVAGMASDHVSEVFSGEGGDELFAGYEYLKSIPTEDLGEELIKITGSLHNTALQRVDRSSSAHGTTAHTVFTNPAIVEFAFTIPDEYKIFKNIEKWILRKSMEGLLPEKILSRPKAKFWEGAGISELISDYAEKNISSNDFRTERYLQDGTVINSKEELFYYRIFRDHFGSDVNLSWMGRTEST